VLCYPLYDNSAGLNNKKLQNQLEIEGMFTKSNISIEFGGAILIYC